MKVVCFTDIPLTVLLLVTRSCFNKIYNLQITTHVGQVKIAKAKINYLEYQAKEPDMDMEGIHFFLEVKVLRIMREFKKEWEKEMIH